MSMGTETSPENPGAAAKAEPRRALAGAAMFSEPDWAEIAQALRLSRRELQVVRGVFEDRTESTMATDLGIARRTVHTYFERLYCRLGVTDRVQLVLRVMEEWIAVTTRPRARPAEMNQTNRLTW